MNDESRKNDINAIPPQARLALAAALIKSLPRETVHEMVAVLRSGGIPEPDIQIINGMGMSQAQLEEAITGTGTENARRAATAEEVADFTRGSVPPLRVGDLVRWRPGYRNCAWPEDEEEVVVSQVISPPLHESRDLGLAESATRHDIAIAFIGDDGVKPGMFEFVYDSRRFERVDSLAPLDEVPQWLRRGAQAPTPPVPEDA